MQRNPATIEEQLILKAINEECLWESLPKRLQATLSTKEEWNKRIIEHCTKKRLQWNTCFARKISKESGYYEDMMHYLRNSMALFPYHLAEYVCRVMRISPFKYYREMIFEVMRNEQPYDSIPNFSAADALRVTGIGRNEFIDIMNKCKSKKIMWKLNKSIVKELLPTQPVDFAIETWWGVCLVNFTLEEFKKLSEEEMATIDKICKEEVNLFVLFDPDIVRGLYQRGLIYFDVPVYPEDRFKVSRLEGFVSNREQSYEDPIEELLYAVFVVSSESATVAELATTLQADLSQLQAAASVACRLGWSQKVIDPASILQDSTALASLHVNISDDEDGSQFSNVSACMSTDGIVTQPGYVFGRQNCVPDSGLTRVALVVDANITSYLMMGSVSPGLKSHAVTLYEAGKLGDASIGDLCQDLRTLEGTKFEGELQEFANHAFSLRRVLECLRSGGTGNTLDAVDVSDELNIASSQNDVSTSLVSESIVFDKSVNTDTNESGLSVHDSMVFAKSPSPSSDDSNTKGINTVSDFHNDVKFIPIGGLDSEKWKKKHRVDILRCESLASLTPATLDRLFLRDYDIVVSMVPLPYSSVVPGIAAGPGLIHFGPPSHLSITPWMKLVLYSTMSCGPLSVVLMKGQRLRLLPAPLAGCEKALVWCWDGSTIGVLGGKFEGNLVKGSVLLHCLNSLLKYSAVLVLPLCGHDLDGCGDITTLDIPLPLKNSDGSIEMNVEDESLNLKSLLTDLGNTLSLPMLGYIRLLKLFNETGGPNHENYEWVPLSIEFGIPLFSPELCDSICNRVASSQLLQIDLLSVVHHDAMQQLRKRLHDICAEFQVTGPAAKLLYQREQPKDPHHQLMNYASGCWNPVTDPSSPISGALSEHHRLKLANRQRCQSEILSFDGTLLRAYALSSIGDSVGVKTEADNSSNSQEILLPGVNLVFDGSGIRAFDIAACLQAHQPVSLISHASSTTAASLTK